MNRVRNALATHPPGRSCDWCESHQGKKFQRFRLSVDCPLHGVPELRTIINECRDVRQQGEHNAS